MSLINKYPDDTSYSTCESANPNIIFRVNTYEDLIHLYQITDAFYAANGYKPVVTIPWLIDGQADKRDAYNKSFGLKIVISILKLMPVEKFRIFHPHNDIAVNMTLDNVEIIDNSEFVKTVLEDIYEVGSYKYNEDFLENLIIIFPDAGAFKWGEKLLKDIRWTGSSYSANKQRPPGDGTEKLKQFIDRQDFEGKDILIIDDLSIYGGTFKGLAIMLKNRNCGKLYLATSHMTVREFPKDPVTDYFDMVYSTNSKFEDYISFKHGEFGRQPDNLKVVKLFEI